MTSENLIIKRHDGYVTLVHVAMCVVRACRLKSIGLPVLLKGQMGLERLACTP